jgi:hypothetical protein
VSEIEDKCAPPLAKAKWYGDSGVLPTGADVDVLAVDVAGRASRHFGMESGVPARVACWILWWPQEADHASFRSCDLADLELSDDDFDRLSSPPLPLHRYTDATERFAGE